MIIAKAPLRISFVGGGTDYPSYYKVHGGAVISTAIKWYVYITASVFPEKLHGHKHKLFYSKIERPEVTADIEHPIIREILTKYSNEDPVEIHVVSDVPAKTGLGSSSSFTVATLAAVHYLTKNKVADPNYLLEGAIDIEQNKLNQIVGSQDQAIAVFGGFNKIIFNKDGSIECHPIQISEQGLKKLESSLFMVFTGSVRKSLDQRENYSKPNAKIDGINTELIDQVRIFEEALLNDVDLEAIGKVLSRGWELKRKVGSNVSSDHIDELYDRGMQHGALGGKLLGAGGGGFLLFIVEEDKAENFENEMSKLAVIFRPQINAPGVKIESI